MAPFQPDDNVTFLHYCVLHATGPGKINWDGVAVAIGSTKGACAIRYKRLKDKIEKDMGIGAGNPANATPTTPHSKAAKDTKKSATPRKRKAADLKVEDADDNASLPPQVDGAADLAPRQTRGKRVNYDVFPGYAGGVFTSDDEVSLISFEDGDGDFVFNPAAVNPEDGDSALFGGQIDDKPNVKRFKMSQSSSISDRITPTRNVAPATPPSPVRKNGTKKIQKSTEPKRANELPTKITIPYKPKAKSSMHPSQQPLSSIEFSPPPTPTPTKKKQKVTSTESYIGVESLRSRAIVKFPVKTQSPVSSVSPTTLERFSTPITIASSVSSSHDSAGKCLKQSLVEHAQQLELRPEDSVSNISVRAEEGSEMARSTPRGLVTNTVRFLKSFLTPRT